jgi:hypothetical protein
MMAMCRLMSPTVPRPTMSALQWGDGQRYKQHEPSNGHLRICDATDGGDVLDGSCVGRESSWRLPGAARRPRGPFLKRFFKAPTDPRYGRICVLFPNTDHCALTDVIDTPFSKELAHLTVEECAILGTYRQ